MLDIMTLPVTVFYQNCRLLVHQETKECVCVDVGGSPKEIYDLIESQDLKLKAILLTHGHLDHVGGAKVLSEISDVDILGPSCEDRFLFESLNEQASAFNLPPCESFEPDRYLKDGEVLNLFTDASFKVIHTPGHTPGGICFYCKEENFVLVGDTLFEGSIGRTDFQRGSYDDLITSIKTKLFVLDDNTDVLTGHGEDTTILKEKQTNPFIK